MKGPNHSQVVRHISDSNCKKLLYRRKICLQKVWDYKGSDKSLDESTWIHEISIHFPKVGDDVMIKGINDKFTLLRVKYRFFWNSKACD